VRRAADALAGGTTPISQVALGAGFVDQPHLTRVFKRECGVTPAAFRRTV
jgi:AraC-like DNA-binding protein